MGTDIDMFDAFLTDRGHEEPETWITDYNKKQCPECFAVHKKDADECIVCNWVPPVESR